MRLKSEIWVKAYLRRCAVQGAFGAVSRKGDDDAGAIFIRVNKLDGTSIVLKPAPAGLAEVAEDRRWVVAGRGAASDGEVDALLGREAEFDGDLWVVEIEDRGGRHFLSDEELLRDGL